ncbi:MAG: cysteine-rich small domain-containing protein [Euryarchaeota archaeon]|nr:cysteine-rich small domain-containing protein [Euryarchaeota archaeon]
MHPLAYDHLKKVLEDKKLVGADETCDYYPCHFTGQDCTWCFCPFYPCEDEQTGGEWVRKKDGSRIWGCSDCYWIHHSEVAKELLAEFKARGIENVDDIEERREELKEIFLMLKEKYPPTPER